MEQLLDNEHPDNDHDLLAQELTDRDRGRIRRAVGELDQGRGPDHPQLRGPAAAGSPVAGQPAAGWTPMDAVESAQRFEEQWDQWMDRALGEGADANAELTDALRYLIGVNAGVGSWNEIARAFDGNYDRSAMAGSVPTIDLRAVTETTLRELETLRAQCLDRSDSLFEQMSAAAETVRTILEVVADRPRDARPGPWNRERGLITQAPGEHPPKNIAHWSASITRDPQAVSRGDRTAVRRRGPLRS